MFCEKARGISVRGESLNFALTMECDDAKPKWAVDHGLKLCGQYFQGFVDDYKAALSHLIHTMETVTSYGVRRRRNAGGSLTAKHLLQSSVKENNDPRTRKPNRNRTSICQKSD